MNSTTSSSGENLYYSKSRDYIKSKVRSIPDWPIKGVIFRDITTLLQDPKAFKEICSIFYNRYAHQKVDKIVGIDARGFLMASVMACLYCPFFIFILYPRKFELHFLLADRQV